MNENVMPIKNSSNKNNIKPHQKDLNNQKRSTTTQKILETEIANISFNTNKSEKDNHSISQSIEIDSFLFDSPENKGDVLPTIQDPIPQSNFGAFNNTSDQYSWLNQLNLNKIDQRQQISTNSTALSEQIINLLFSKQQTQQQDNNMLAGQYMFPQQQNSVIPPNFAINNGINGNPLSKEMEKSIESYLNPSNIFDPKNYQGLVQQQQQQTNNFLNNSLHNPSVPQNNYFNGIPQQQVNVPNYIQTQGLYYPTEYNNFLNQPSLNGLNQQYPFIQLEQTQPQTQFIPPFNFKNNLQPGLNENQLVQPQQLCNSLLNIELNNKSNNMNCNKKNSHIPSANESSVLSLNDLISQSIEQPQNAKTAQSLTSTTLSSLYFSSPSFANSLVNYNNANGSHTQSSSNLFSSDIFSNIVDKVEKNDQETDFQSINNLKTSNDQIHKTKVNIPLSIKNTIVAFVNSPYDETAISKFMNFVQEAEFMDIRYIYEYFIFENDFSTISTIITKLCLSLFGNYLIQTLIEKSLSFERVYLMGAIWESMNEINLNSHGTRCVQKFIISSANILKKNPLFGEDSDYLSLSPEMRKVFHNHVSNVVAFINKEKTFADLEGKIEKYLQYLAKCMEPASSNLIGNNNNSNKVYDLIISDFVDNKECVMKVEDYFSRTFSTNSEFPVYKHKYLNEISILILGLSYVHGDLENPCVKNYMMNPHGNHTVQRIIETYNEADPCLTVTFFSQILHNLYEIVKHQYGCCVFQKVIACAKEKQNSLILLPVLNNVIDFSKNKYSNYVIQYILKTMNIPKKNNTNWEIFLKLQQTLINHETELIFDKCGSHVLETLFVNTTPENRIKIATKLLGSTKFPKMVIDEYGNYVISTILRISKIPEFEERVLEIAQKNPTNMYVKFIIQQYNSSQTKLERK